MSRRVECPTCGTYRVWAQIHGRFMCPCCQWPSERRKARRQSIDAATARHNGWRRHLRRVR